MLDIVFGCVLLAVIAALVLLFAMFGELASRMPAERRPERSADVYPLEDARLGVEPGRWPESLAGVSGATGPSIVLVLSTACTTCDDVAAQVSGELDQGGAGDLAVVVSTGDEERAWTFIDRYGLRRLPHHIDDKGQWVGDEFNVRMSPTAMVFQSGRLHSAMVFQDVNALRETVSVPKGVL